jgi:hypothetical protein
MYGLKPVPFREERRTSGAKALITPANYGTAEAVPFVQQRNSKLAPREKLSPRHESQGINKIR